MTYPEKKVIHDFGALPLLLSIQCITYKIPSPHPIQIFFVIFNFMARLW